VTLAPATSCLDVHVDTHPNALVLRGVNDCADRRRYRVIDTLLGVITLCRPMAIAYVTGDATVPNGTGARIIVHVCNDAGGWGRGFVLAISKRWPQPEVEYRRWARGDGTKLFELGQVQFVEVERALWVANMIGQRGTRAEGGRPPVRYDAIRAGLAAVREFAQARAATVHMPRIGAGLAGGRWDEIAVLIKDELVVHDIAVTVYDLPPR
jgi:O-acetyl-ADP-ribose deacetylase (regulator of RNase III)